MGHVRMGHRGPGLSIASPINCSVDLDIIDTEEAMELEVGLAELEAQLEVLLGGLGNSEDR